MEMKLNIAQRKLLTQLGTKIVSHTGDEYFFLPLWFKIGKFQDTVDAYSFGHLPPDLRAAITDIREDTHDLPVAQKWPLTEKECEK